MCSLWKKIQVFGDPEEETRVVLKKDARRKTHGKRKRGMSLWTCRVHATSVGPSRNMIHTKLILILTQETQKELHHENIIGGSPVVCELEKQGETVYW